MEDLHKDYKNIKTEKKSVDLCLELHLLLFFCYFLGDLLK